MRKAYLSALFAVFVSSLCVAYENDGPGYDPSTPKKVRLMSSSNSFKPPEPSDICFVVTEGGDIGETKGQGETITIPLNIPRYFGNKNKLLKSGALSEYAVLTMVVYDVDSKSSNNPEVDKVYLNGKKYLGTMWGDNAVYYQNQFIINTKDLNLAEYLGGVGSNTIDIKVDVNNGGWITHVKWISLYIPAAPPVILAHGINSSGAQLAKLAKEIEDQTGLPTYHYLNFNNHGNDHIDQYSELSAVIQSYKKICGVDQVNIVGHSMGGLRARGYAENASDVFKVLQVGTPNGGSPIADFMIDWEKYVETGLQQEKQLGYLNDQEVKDQIEAAKNKIKAIAKKLVDMDLDPWRDKAIFCLQRNMMNKFNAYNKLNADVEYCVVAGNVTDYQLPVLMDGAAVYYLLSKNKKDINKEIKEFVDYYFESSLLISEHDGYAKAYLQDHFNELLSDTLFVKTDLVVPVYSAHTKIPPIEGSPLSGKRKEVWHSGLISDGAERVVKCLKPKLVEQKMVTKGRRTSSAIGNRSTSIRKSANYNLVSTLTVDEESEGGVTDIQTGVVSSGKNTSASFGILQGHHAMIILDISTDEIKSTALRLKAPSGKVYEDCAQNVLMTNGISNAVVMLANPEKGKWTLEWTSAFSNSADIGIWTLAAFEVDDGVVFSPKLVNTSVAVGGTFALTVSPKVGEAVVSGTVKVVATAPNGTSAIYNATQDASGAFSAQIPATAVGTYTFAVRLDASSPSVFSRSSIISGVVHSGGAGFLQSHSAVVPDVDSNGLYDNLTVNFAVNATKAGTYRVLATLADTDGNEITEGWTSNIVCSAGTQTFPVAFDGRAIYGNGECGGYKVSSAKLLEVGEGYEAVVDERDDLFMTTVYTYKQFEHDLVAIKSGGSDSAVDVNGDGTYDRLDVTIPLYADDRATGSYEWSASLMDADGFLLGTASGYVTFISGQGGASISMSFDRDGIVATHKNGMYYVKNLIVWGNGRNLTIPGEYVTAIYNIEDFGGELATVDLGFILPQGWSDSLIISTNATAMTSQIVFEQGDPIYLNYAFKNVANQAAVSNFVNRFTLSNGSSYSDSWIGYGLKEGGWGWLGESFAPTMLQNLPAGTYTLTCELDVVGQLPETNEFNNVMDVTFTIKESLRPNLKISSASVSRDCFTVSDSVVFHWRVENMGRVAATKTKTAFRIWKYDSSSEEWMLKKTEYLDCISLATGGGREFTRTISGKTFGTGEFAIDLCADGKGSLVELNESDNNEFVFFTVSKDNVAKSSSGVDWQFKKVNKSDPDSFYLSTSSSSKKKATTFKAGQTIYMRCGFWNATKKAVNGSMKVTISLNGGSGIYLEGSYFQKNYYYYNINRTPGFLQNLPAGKYTLTAVLDSENNWTEKNEENNVKTISFTVVDTPQIFGCEEFTCALNESVVWPISSEGTVTCGKLPSGLKYSGGAIVGKATKVGTYAVKFTAKNAKGSVSRNIRIIVTNPGFEVSIARSSNVDSGNPSVNIGAGAVVPVYVGVGQRFTLDATPKKDGVSKSAVSSISVSGLPSGMKYSKGVISGAPTKTGTYTVKIVFKNALKWSETFTWKMKVLPLPEWAKGQFSGYAATADGESVSENFSMSVGSTGKISGKFKLGGTNWTFSASSFAAEAAVDGMTNLLCAVNAKATVKVGKKNRTFMCPMGFTLVPDSDTSEIASHTEDGFFGDGEFYARRNPGIRITKTAGGTVSMDKSYGQVASGKSVKFTAKPSKGYAFCGWYDENGTLVSQSLAYSATMAENDRFFSAVFKKESELAHPELDWGGETDIMVGVAYETKPRVVAEAAVKIISVTGLPKGLEYKSGKVKGVPTSAKTYTVTVKVALGTNAKKTWTFKLPLYVTALPEWAKGSFNGGYYWCGLNGDTGEESETFSHASLTISSAGKISGKMYKDGAVWTFSAASFASQGFDEFGNLHALVADVTYTSGKTKKKMPLIVTAEYVSGCDYLAYRNRWGSVDMADAAAEMVGAQIDLGDGVKLTVGASGKVTAKGKIGTYSASGSAVLCDVNDGSGIYDLYIYFAPDKKKKFSGYARYVRLLWNGGTDFEIAGE